MSAVAQPYPHAHEGQEVTETKDEMRGLLRAARAARSPRRRSEAAAALVDVLLTLPALEGARTVAAYSARPTEPDTLPLLDALDARGITVLLPVLDAGADDLLQRAPGRPTEPSGPTLGAEGLAQADLILAPALAVDTAGTRLGQGGGWYDRALQHARPGVPVVAVVFAEEVYDADRLPLPREEHDRPVDLAITPERWLPLGR
jgi:5-formyltetrahydrofolate cyclo-ligase